MLEEKSGKINSKILDQFMLSWKYFMKPVSLTWTNTSCAWVRVCACVCTCVCMHACACVCAPYLSTHWWNVTL